MRSTPTIANAGRGISRIKPSSRLMSVGVPQPSLAIGPIRKRPSCGGKMRFRSLMMRGALATTSVGNRMLFERAVAHAEPQRVEQHRAIEPEQAADAEQREAERQLDRRELARR